MGLNKSGVVAATVMCAAVTGGIHPRIRDGRTIRSAPHGWKQLQESIFPHRQVLAGSGSSLLMRRRGHWTAPRSCRLSCISPATSPVKAVYSSRRQSRAHGGHFVLVEGRPPGSENCG